MKYTEHLNTLVDHEVAVVTIGMDEIQGEARCSEIMDVLKTIGEDFIVLRLQTVGSDHRKTEIKGRCKYINLKNVIYIYHDESSCKKCKSAETPK